jgi:hypothetical protein
LENKYAQSVSKHPYFSFFQEKKEAGDDASSPSADSAVAESNAIAETNSSADNVPYHPYFYSFSN